MTQATAGERPSGQAAGRPGSAETGSARPANRWTTAMDGQQLRHLRRQHGLSQEGLADQAGISLTTIARLERQHCSPCRTWTLARLAAALGEQPASMTFASSPMS